MPFCASYNTWLAHCLHTSLRCPRCISYLHSRLLVQLVWQHQKKPYIIVHISDQQGSAGRELTTRFHRRSELSELVHCPEDCSKTLLQGRSLCWPSAGLPFARLGRLTCANALQIRLCNQSCCLTVHIHARALDSEETARKATKITLESSE